MKVRRKPVQREKSEQAAGVELLQKIGAKVYVLGTRRPSGKPCPKCGTFVREHQGTCQTPGIADVFAFLPPRPPKDDEYLPGPRRLLVWEAKAPAAPGSRGGRPSDAQKEFLALCADANVRHVLGDLNQLVGWLIERGYVKADRIPHYRVPAQFKEAV